MGKYILERIETMVYPALYYTKGNQWTTNINDALTFEYYWQAQYFYNRMDFDGLVITTVRVTVTRV